MKKLQFAKSVTAGVLGLTLLSGCSGVAEKMGMNKCAGKKTEASNSCSSHSCAAKKAKESSNSCSSNSCEAKKETKSSHSCSSNGCKSSK